MTIDEQINDTEREIKNWKVTVRKRRKAVQRAEGRLKVAQFNVEVWQSHLRILIEEAGK